MNKQDDPILQQTLVINGTVYTAGDARMDGATPSRLQQIFRQQAGSNSFLAQLADFLAEWFNDTPSVHVHTSGSTGPPQDLLADKQRMMNSARMTVSFLGLRPGDKALLCMPLQYIAGKMVVVRALAAGLDLIPVTPTSHPMRVLPQSPDFAALVPMQVYHSLQSPQEYERLAGIRHLIIGGGPIDATMADQLRSFPYNVWSTYGMTETLSHIALRKLNGADATDGYVPLPGVTLSTTSSGTLVIDAPSVCPETLTTRDIVEWTANGRFRVLGRLDNTINTGGVKVQAEAVEERLRPFLNEPFMITSTPDPQFGECIVLLVQAPASVPTSIHQAIQHLPPYWRPKHIVSVPQLPQTGTGKPNRAAAKSLAATLLIPSTH